MTVFMQEELEHIVEACKKGDSQAKRMLVQKLSGKISGICRRYIVNQSEKEDLVQEIYIKLFRHLNSYDSRKGEFGAWVYKIALNETIRYNKKNINDFVTASISEYEEYQYVDEGLITPNDIDDKLSAQELLKYIEQLPQGRRMIFNMFYIEGYKHEEIANMLEISVGTSKSQLNKARNQFINLLKKNRLINEQF